MSAGLNLMVVPCRGPRVEWGPLRDYSDAQALAHQKAAARGCPVQVRRDSRAGELLYQANPPQEHRGSEDAGCGRPCGEEPFGCSGCQGVTF